MTHISSGQNPRIKHVILLQSKAKARKEKEQFVVEGRRELLLAQQAQYKIETLYWCPEIFEKTHFERWITDFSSTLHIVSVSLTVYQKIVMRNTTEGVVGVVQQQKRNLSSWKTKNRHPVLIVVEGVEKPGNLGAILRTADAAKVDGVLVTACQTDIHNPNVVRSSVGGFFSVPIFNCSNEEAKAFLLKKNVKMYAASLQKSVLYTTIDYTKATALIMGSEANGISAFWRTDDITPIKIPMLGHVDSLNVSVASSILIYEIIRQRNG